MADDRSFTILIVDDDDDIREIVSQTLSILEVSVVLARDGEEAIEQYRKTSPDLLVLDVMMPRMDGNEVCSKVRSSEGGELVSILMLTAKDSVKDIVGGLDGGADDYLTKPFHYAELIARVRALLRVRKLNLTLKEAHDSLKEMQAKLLEQERKVALSDMAATAAHQLGQPLAAILLNCHLLEKLSKEDEQFSNALEAIKSDSRRMKGLLGELKAADSAAPETYYGSQRVLRIGKGETLEASISSSTQEQTTERCSPEEGKDLSEKTNRAG